METIKFETYIKGGVINIPVEYQKVCKNGDIRYVCIIQTQKNTIKKKMTAIGIDTKSYKFNRDEANENNPHE